MDNIDVFKYFNMKFLKKYLLMIRESSITNMYGAGPYLYMGRERIEHEFKYQDIHNEDAFEEVLDHANQAQAEMINGVINYLEDKGIEEDMSSINRYLQRFAAKIVQTYTFL
jgi:beta-phosphoglucomutase-like phosphatase (HAD superfamily)